MRELFYKMYARFVYNKFYYGIYSSSASRFNFWIYVFSCATCVSGISGWFIWKQIPWLWAIILALSQVISIVSDKLPFSKRINAAGYFISEVDCLINDVENDWRKINLDNSNVSDSTINEMMEKYQSRFTEIDHRYTTKKLFPDNDKFRKKAAIQRDEFLDDKYGGDSNVQQKYPTEAATAESTTVSTSNKSPI